jgi:hypothetical protein
MELDSDSGRDRYRDEDRVSDKVRGSKETMTGMETGLYRQGQGQ